MGIPATVMLTGDNDATAQTVAQSIGVTEVYSNLLPEDKVDAIKTAPAALPHRSHGRRRHQRRPPPWPKPP